MLAQVDETLTCEIDSTQIDQPIGSRYPNEAYGDDHQVPKERSRFKQLYQPIVSNYLLKKDVSTSVIFSPNRRRKVFQKQAENNV